MVIEKLAAQIQVRHYSRKTLKHYADWCRKFQSYLKDKDPGELSSQDVKDYFTYLAVTCKVSSSHQNLASNSLLFLYRHVLSKDFGNHTDIPCAKLGHADIRTTMIYLHCIPGKVEKEVKSPLDFSGASS